MSDYDLFKEELDKHPELHYTEMFCSKDKTKKSICVYEGHTFIIIHFDEKQKLKEK